MEVRIESVREAFRIDRAGNTSMVTVILYMVGNQGPFTYETPTADFDDARVKAELESRAAKIRALFPAE